MRNLNFCFITAITGLFITSAALAQQPMLLFSQVAVGGTPALGIESVATFTNSGTEEFEGILRFWTGDGEMWNLTVGGQPIQGGQITLNVEAFETKSILLTGSDLKVGYAVLTANDSPSSSVEGNLTYFVRSQGDILDSVGVAPSVGLYRSTVPFADFSTVGLALASTQPTPYRLKLRDDSGTVVETVDKFLGSNAHSSKFLSELFSTSVAGGRVDLESDVPLFGTAVTFASGQISTLPVLPSRVEYDINVAAEDGTQTEGKLAMLAEGIFIRGFLELTSEDGMALSPTAKTPIEGRLIDGNLRLVFYVGGPDFFDEESIIYAEAGGFSFALESFTADFVETELSDESVNSGTFLLTRTTEP